MSIVNGISFVRVDELLWDFYDYRDSWFATGTLVLAGGVRNFRLEVSKDKNSLLFVVYVEVFDESEFSFTFDKPILALDSVGFEIGKTAAVRYLNGLVIDRHTGGSFGEGRKEVGVELRAIH